jgi:hypothetical protein
MFIAMGSVGIEGVLQRIAINVKPAPDRRDGGRFGAGIEAMTA